MQDYLMSNINFIIPNTKLHLVVANFQSFGDILISTHIARIVQKYSPLTKVHFCIRPDLTLTTAETDVNALPDIINILYKQENIASVGYIYPTGIKPMVGDISGLTNDNYDLLVINGWSSDLGIVKSQLKPIYDLYDIPGPIDTETKYNIEQLPKPSTLTVGLAGEVDFLRKWHNKPEYDKFIDYLLRSSHNFNIERFGVDISTEPYSKQMQRLSSCHLLISPMGSLIHFAAGIGVDTINITSVFPAEFDCPEFYHTGWHRHVKPSTPFHCKTFECVSNKSYDNQLTWGNPATKWGFWPINCPNTKNGYSCNKNTTADSLIQYFEEWYDNRNRNKK